MKKIIKQFRAPFKSNSPNMKKKLHDAHSNNNKLCFSTNNPKKKNSAQQQPTTKNNIINKNLTETGPIIKKVTQKRLGPEKEREKPEKKSNVREEKRKEEKVEKTAKGKKLAECKSADELVRDK